MTDEKGWQLMPKHFTKIIAVVLAASLAASLAGCADGRHELQNTDTGGGIGYDGV